MASTEVISKTSMYGKSLSSPPSNSNRPSCTPPRQLPPISPRRTIAWNPSTQRDEIGLGIASVNVDVTGKDRAKYFQKPAAQNHGVVTLDNYVLAEEKMQVESLSSRPNSEPQQPEVQSRTRTIEVQTLYRESDVQTDPYSPPIKLKDGQPVPEVVRLAELGLKYGKGLPIGQEEMELIERDKQKRKFDASLPPLDSEDSIELRKKMLEEQEEREWKYREEQIKKQQTTKLQKLQQTIKLQEKERETASNKKVESIMMRAMAKRDDALSRIEHDKIQTMRKMAKQRENIEGKKVKRDIVLDYVDHGSKVYAPVTRDGRRRDPTVLQDVRPPTLATLGGIESVERKLLSRLSKRKPFATTPSQPLSPATALKKTMTLQPKPEEGPSFTDPRIKSTLAKQEKEISEHLDKLDESIRLNKTKREEKKERPSVAEKIEKPPPRPATPSVHPPEESEEKEQAVILLQYLIRGRAIQNQMYEGKTRRAELIAELKAADSYKDIEEQDSTSSQSKPAEDDQQLKEQLALQQKKKMAEGVLDEILGAYVGQALDFLSKELVRQQQEQKLMKMVQEAEQTRRMREAEESGKRQLERQLQINEDEQFKQIMEVHQQTAASYLEDILEEAVLSIAEKSVIEEEKKKLEDEKHMSTLDMPPEQIVLDLVFSHLFPIVEERSSKDKAHQEEHKYGRAALDALSSLLPEIARGITVQ